MPRPRSHTKESLASAAMQLFWYNGYAATSMDHLVRGTGVSRHGIYSDYGGKHALFVAGFDIYQHEVVTPAFAQVESSGADLQSVAAYFEQQIARAEALGLPGPGCLVANTMTEPAAHDDDVATCLQTHLDRLRAGFTNVLVNEQIPHTHVHQIAETMTVFTQGLWSASRVTNDADSLRQTVANFLQLINHRIRS